jgi:hypothetical protein
MFAGMAARGTASKRHYEKSVPERGVELLSDRVHWGASAVI